MSRIRGSFNPPNGLLTLDRHGEVLVVMRRVEKGKKESRDQGP